MGILLAFIQGGLFIPAFLLFLFIVWIIFKCVDKYDARRSRARSAELERIIRRATDKDRK